MRAGCQPSNRRLRDVFHYSTNDLVEMSRNHDERRKKRYKMSKMSETTIGANEIESVLLI